MSQNTILTHEQINHIIKRIAYQIYETFIDEGSITMAGIASNGYVLATKIAKEIELISSIKVTLCEVKIDKNNPNSAVTTSIQPEKYQNKGLVLVDDVLNSGTTLIYGVKHFLEVPISKFKTVVLVDRNHKKYPVKADFKGISLSTSSKEHVTVVFENDSSYAYLE
jgi:pyrimidine operon attenuation protein / uracil phosphoribosyltransferase